MDSVERCQPTWHPALLEHLLELAQAELLLRGQHLRVYFEAEGSEQLRRMVLLLGSACAEALFEVCHDCRKGLSGVAFVTSSILGGKISRKL